MAIAIPIAQTKTNNPNVTFSLKPDFLSQRDFQSTAREGDSKNENPVAPGSLAGLVTTHRASRILLASTLGLALLIGLIFIAWSTLFSGENKSDPWQSSPENERKYINWVTDRYSRTGSISQAEKDLSSWKRDDLALLFAAMIRETSDAKARQRLAALAEVLRLPVADTSLLPAIFRQPSFILGLLLTALPIFAAISLLVVSNVRKRQTLPESLTEETGTARKLDELPKDVELEELTLGQEDQDEQEEKTEEPQEEAEQEQEQEQEPGLGDLASLFEEEDTSISALEAFCKGLAEITVDQLLTNASEVIRRFRNGRRAD